jgi:uncharacterized protein YbaR (Trm112 family)
MFVELVEFLRCPIDTTESVCIVLPDKMVGRMVMTGTIACPVSKREYRIDGGIADFRSADPLVELPAAPGAVSTDAATVQALLGVTAPGGYIVLMGSAAHVAADLADHIGGVHFVAINPPEEVEPFLAMSVLRGPVPVPLRSSMARGVVIGREYGIEPWLSEGERVLLKGLRVVVLLEGVNIPNVEQLASGEGLWVGQKT